MLQPFSRTDRDVQLFRRVPNDWHALNRLRPECATETGLQEIVNTYASPPISFL